MEFITHSKSNTEIAEINAKDLLFSTKEEGSDLIGTVYFNGFDRVILHQKNLPNSFFDLKTGVAGEVLQKSSNFRIRMAIVMNEMEFSSKSLNDFIRESNRGNQLHFVTSLEEGIEFLSR